MSGSPSAFDVSKMAIGGIGQMLDSVEFVKRAWSTLNIPSTLVPTVDVEELDKRIADLKAVEQWLNVNLSMLHGTIQGLEIQRGTLAAVKAFGASLGNLRVPGTDEAAALAAVRARTAPPAAAPQPAPAEPPPMQAAAEPRPAAATRGAAKKGAAAQPAAARPAQPPAMPGLDPSAWWNMLQQNFNQVAEAALSGGGLQGAAANALKTAGSIAGAAARTATSAASGGSGGSGGSGAAGAAGASTPTAEPTAKPAATRKRTPAAKPAAPTRTKTPRAGR